MSIEAIVEEKQYTVREFQPEDLLSIIEVYQKAFAGEPWNEYRICKACYTEYSKEEFMDAVNKNQCKSCLEPLNTEEYWKPEDIIKNLNDTLSKKEGIVYVAENGQGVVGFVWGSPGYPDNREENLGDIIRPESFYLKEIAVSADCQDKGVGSTLAKAFVDEVKERGYNGTYLRTNLNNHPAIHIFHKVGYRSTSLRDVGKKDCFYMIQGDCYV
ncbi:MAG: N-acetyltransferase family protein [Candidatus Woesearchaeota archaeon]